jgi:phage FluMu protein Com
MDFRKSKLYSVLNNKCPHCHQGNFFENNNAYKLSSFAVMNKKCPRCNEDFIREPGYYFGATYVSYSLTVGLGIFMYGILGVLLKMDTLPFILVFSGLLLLLMPVLYRLSRLIWINFFVHYKEEATKQQIL